MDGNLEISLDKLPVKRLDAIEENGAERYPPDSSYDEKGVSLIRRIDFAWAVEDDEERERKKKQKKSSKDASAAWQWQSMVENLQLAHQELSVIIDLINTVEANDAVTVAGMTRPKPLPNEVLSDLAVSAATKLQCYRQLGKYFKQSAKAFKEQIAWEARFYGALIRLQQNWKVKRQRVAASASSNEGFTIDLFDNSLYDLAAMCRPSSLSTIRVEHDSAGMLAINLTPNSCRSLHFGFLGVHSADIPKNTSKIRTHGSVEQRIRESEKESISDDDYVKETHTLLREVHQSIFNDQVFEMLNREAFNQSVGVNVTGIRENYLQLSIGQGNTLFISLMPSNKGDNQDSADTQNLESAIVPSHSFDTENKWVFPNRTSCEIYLQQIFHENAFVKEKDKPNLSGTQASGQSGKVEPSLLGHRIFSSIVLTELENVVCRVPYLHLMTHPTWHSRTSSWTVFMKVPQSILHAESQSPKSDFQNMKEAIKSQFRTKVVLNDDRINVEGEGAPNVVGLFKSSENICSVNKYECDLADLPVIILLQVASQVIYWLHEEALTVGIKTNRDFLCLTFELEQGETVSLVAHVNPGDIKGGISWWLVMEDGFAEDWKLQMDMHDGASDYRKFLGHLTLDVLYSTSMDLVSMCGGGRNH
ncbi:Mediator of RNA polymerase II transcription subunit 17 [Hibiscus syriacus]|uniref:Mediator of RNA polymerase II transcription subunit 17 n=1 Tax=Hibiscus syriacus TaxID=106335 RepID=A0A6A3C2K1_HIBSY|nr:mediator of RNA polymerase II transcription subunit 17-like [Hibiscus syriacus]KAE8721329.1 Mediator of RNA polymerase II transcription subunit 17 [Hibiscus syriacus]